MVTKNNLSCIQIFLGDYPSSIFSEKTPQHLIQKFQEDLRQITHEIIERNDALDVPYNYMRPDRVPNSITI